MKHFNVSDVTERFIRYASIYTQSKEGVPDTPSTLCQFNLARLLRGELEEMGAAEVSLDEEKCYVYATIPGNIPADPAAVAALPDAGAKRRENLAPIIGLIAHMDTTDAVDASSHPFILPRRIDDYDGGSIVLNEALGITCGPEEYPDLAGQRGKTLVVTDGTTVLGGDDKAGITQIMEAAGFFLSHPEIAHGTIRIMFTPDEEVGNGIMNMDTGRFAVDYAYTVDSTDVGRLEYECFNAAAAEVLIEGLSTHPGSAKGRMRNAVLLAMEFNSLLPAGQTPADTEGYEGFWHLCEMSGTTEKAKMDYIIRDHDRSTFEARKEMLLQIAAGMNLRYGADVVRVRVRDSYYNMEEKIRPHMHLVEVAKAAICEVGLEPLVAPIRGGTDGAMLSFRGIPCPNLGTGAHCIHSQYEYAVGEEMVLGAEILLRILNRYASYELDG